MLFRVESDVASCKRKFDAEDLAFLSAYLRTACLCVHSGKCSTNLLREGPFKRDSSLSSAEETNLRKSGVTLPENVLLSGRASGHTRGRRTSASLDGAEGGAEHVGLVPAPEGARVVALRRSTPLGAAVAEPAEKARLALEVGAGLKW